MRKKFKIVKERQFEGMYRVKYPDDELSADFYNLPRAKEHVFYLSHKELGYQSR